jgi:putative Holliday junction resolvase
MRRFIAGAARGAAGRRTPRPRRRRRLTHPRAAPYIPAMRYLGIDLGRATIGLALADDVLRTATPLHTIRRSAEAPDLAQLRRVVEEYEVDTVVVGLPLNMDGTEGASARMARAWAARLGASLPLRVELRDERLTTFEAEQRLRDRGLTARDQRAVIDAEAAAVILQSWLDARGA